ncbi:MAG: cation:proton antiporter [Phycisphaerales bacterium]|nr:cation:proton antiporter [Phycisphaerales bacterium]
MILATAGHSGGVVVDLVVVLLAAGASSLMLGKLRLAAIPGYLIAGVLLGAFYHGSEGGGIDAIRGLAVILLMFGIGLHLDLDHMKHGVGPILATGALSTALVALLVWPAAMGFGLDWRAALVVGMACSMSSTAVVLRVLQQRRELESTWGRVAFGILIVQDLFAIGVMAAVPALAPAGTEAAAEGTGGGRSAVVDALIAIGAIAGFIIVSKFVLPRILAAAAKVAAEVMLVLASAVALSAAALTTSVGLSPELGAFIAGFVLAGTPFKYELSGQLAPLRDLFMAVFFTAVGLGADLSVLAQEWWVVLLATLVLALIKAVSISASAWALGATPRAAAMNGLALFQAGEFGLVIIAVAASKSILTPEQSAVFIGVTIVTLIVTPGVLSVAHHIAEIIGRHAPRNPWLASSLSSDESEPQDAQGAMRDHVVVAGFGPVGRAVADRLAKAGVTFSIIELNPDTVRKQRSLGRSAHFGDVTNEEVLASAGVPSARAIVIAVPDDDAMIRSTRLARKLNQTALILSRANALSSGLRAKGLGADHVVVEELITAEAMASQVLMRMGKLAPGNGLRRADAGAITDSAPGLAPVAGAGSGSPDGADSPATIRVPRQKPKDQAHE